MLNYKVDNLFLHLYYYNKEQDLFHDKCEYVECSHECSECDTYKFMNHYMNFALYELEKLEKHLGREL